MSNDDGRSGKNPEGRRRILRELTAGGGLVSASVPRTWERPQLRAGLVGGRRKLLIALSASGGLVTAALLPKRWLPPILDAVAVPDAQAAGCSPGSLTPSQLCTIVATQFCTGFGLTSCTTLQGTSCTDVLVPCP